MHGAISPVPQHAFMAWCSVKKEAQVYLYLYQCLNRRTEKVPGFNFSQITRYLDMFRGYPQAPHVNAGTEV